MIFLSFTLLFLYIRPQTCDISNLTISQLQFSGKFFNDLGNYKKCQLKEQSHYLTLQIFTFSQAILYTGLCLPVQCQAKELNQQYSDLVKDYLNVFFMSILNTTQPVVSLTQLYDPQMKTTNITSYIFLGVFILWIMGLMLISFIQPQNKIIKSFDFIQNFKKIFTLQSSQPNLSYINGIRVLSLLYVILGHNLGVSINLLKNFFDVQIILQQTWGLTTITQSALYAVDTFFYLGGFLVCISMLPQILKNDFGIMFYLKLVLHRFLRIWPAMFIAIIFLWQLVPILNDSVMEFPQQLSSPCGTTSVFYSLFFINNFINHATTQECLGWGWYLANDFQFYLITPFILVIYKRRKIFGVITILLLLMMSFLANFILTNKYQCKILIIQNQSMDCFDQIYIRPYTRIQPHLVGLLAGLLYYENWIVGKSNFFITKMRKEFVIRVILYIVGIGITFGLVFMIVPLQKNDQFPQWANNLHAAFSKSLFVFGIFLFTLPATYDCKLDPIQTILGFGIFTPLAKLSFAMYLVHFGLLYDVLYSFQSIHFYSVYQILSQTFATTIVVMVMGLFLSVMIEGPVLQIEKLIWRKESSKEREQVKEQLVVNKEQSNNE